LDKVAEVTTLKQTGGLENLFIGLAKIVGAIAKYTGGYVWRGFHLGVNEIEKGIVLGSSLTVFGEVVYNLSDKTLRILTPLVFLKDKKHFLTLLKNKVTSSTVGMVFFAVPLVLSTLYLVQKFTTKRAERRAIAQ